MARQPQSAQGASTFKQDVDLDVVSTLRLTELDSFLTLDNGGTRRYSSPNFGPGWRIQLKFGHPDDKNVSGPETSKSSDQRELSLGVKLSTPEEQEASFDFRVTITLTTLSNQPIKRLTFAREMSGGKRVGYWPFLTKTLLWDKNEIVRRDNAVLLTVRVLCNTTNVPVRVSHRGGRLPQPAASWVARSLTSPDELPNVKFILYRKKPKNSVDADAIQCVYANDKVLSEASSYFASNQHFAEGKEIVNIDSDIGKMPPFSPSYDYQSDSDLEVDDDDDSDGMSEDEDPEQLADSEADDESTNIETDEPVLPSQTVRGDATSRAYDDRDEEMEQVQSESKPQRGTKSTSSVSTKGKTCRTGCLVHVPDVAYNTWLAMTFYIYTGNIEFAPLSSDVSISYSEMNEDHLYRNPSHPDLVSCKSIYRLAEKLGLKELENLACAHLASQLNDTVIFPELFSSFTSRYSRIQDIQAAYLLKNWTRLNTSDVLQKKIGEVVAGRIPHCAWLLNRIVAQQLQPPTGC